MTNVEIVKIHHRAILPIQNYLKCILFKQTIPKAKIVISVFLTGATYVFYLLSVLFGHAGFIKLKSRLYSSGEFSWLIYKCIVEEQEAGLGQDIEIHYDYLNLQRLHTNNLNSVS